MKRVMQQVLWLTGLTLSTLGSAALATSATSTTTTNNTTKTAQTTQSTHTSHTTQTSHTTHTTKTTPTSKTAHNASTKTKTAAKASRAYTFDFNPPRSSEWQLVQNAFDANGYARTYMLPQTGDAIPESVTISYGRNIHTSLKASMQEVVGNFKKINCKQKQSQTIQKKDSTLVFSTTISQCNNGKALHQIFKVFNMPDGQYSIIYSADPRKTPASDIAQMQKAVVAGKLVPIQTT